MKIELTIILLVPLFGMPSIFPQTDLPIGNLGDELEKSKELTDRIMVLIYSDSKWRGEIQDGDFISHSVDGTGDKALLIPCGQTNIISVSVVSDGDQNFDVYLVKEGKFLEYSENTSWFSTTALDCSISNISQQQGLKLSMDHVYVAIPIIIGSIIAVVIIVNAQKNRYDLK